MITTQIIRNRGYRVGSYAVLAAMFGGGMNETLIRRSYGSTSLKKRNRAKDYLCTMLADCFTTTGVFNEEEAFRYAMEFGRPLMKHRNNYIYLNVWQALYIPMIRLTLSKKVMGMAWVAVTILGELRRARDCIKTFNRFFLWVKDNKFELTTRGKCICAANATIRKRDGLDFVIRKMGGKNGAMYKALPNIFDTFGLIGHPALTMFAEVYGIINSHVSKLTSWLDHNILDSRVKAWDSKDVQANIAMVDESLMGKKRLSRIRQARLQGNRKILWLYLLVRLMFDRENKLKWQFVFSPDLKLQLELAESGLVLFNSFVKGFSDFGKPMTFEYRPAVIAKLGKLWRVLPIDIGYVPKRGRGSRWLSLSGVDSLFNEIVELPKSRDPDGPSWGAWMIEQIAGVMGRTPHEVPNKDWRLNDLPNPKWNKDLMPPGAGAILRNRLACDIVQKEQQERFLKDMLSGREVDWSYNFNNVTDLFRGRIRHRR